MKYKIHFLFLIFSFISLGLFAQEDKLTILSIDISELERTKEAVIVNELEFSEGERYSKDELEEKFAESIQNLLNTNIIETVDIKYEEVNGGITVSVDVAEKWTLVPVAYPYYDTVSGLGVSVKIVETNLFGYNKNLVISGEYDDDKTALLVVYNDKNFLGTDFNFTSTGFYIDRSEFITTPSGLILYEGRANVRGGLFGGLMPLNDDESLKIGAMNLLFSKEYTDEINRIGINLKDVSFSYVLLPIFVVGTFDSIGFNQRGYELFYILDVAPIYDEDPRYGARNINNIYIAPFLDTNTFNIIRKSQLNLRLGLFYYNDEHIFLLNNRHISFVQTGSIRGNYGYYFNSSYSLFLFNIEGIKSEVYIPLIFESADAFFHNEDFSFDSATNVVASGITLAPRGVNVTFEFMIGYNLVNVENGDTDPYVSININGRF